MFLIVVSDESNDVPVAAFDTLAGVRAFVSACPLDRGPHAPVEHAIKLNGLAMSPLGYKVFRFYRGQPEKIAFFGWPDRPETPFVTNVEELK